MTDIILFQPKLENSILDREKPNLPLGLLSVASTLDKKYKVKIIDQRIDNNWKDNLSKELKKNPIIFGTTTITGNQITTVLDVSRFVKETSNIPVVWGGTHITLQPKQTLNNEYIDFGMVGEGEITFLELVEAIENNKPLNNIKGLCYKKDGKVILNESREFINLDDIPALPFHLINPEDYLGKEKSLDIFSSRGCPYNCAYCYNHAFHKQKWRGLSKSKLRERIEQYVNLGARKLYFVDDDMIPNRVRIRDVCEVLNNFNIEWTCLVDFGILSKLNLNELKMLRRSGCINFMMGVETIAPKLRKLINKQIVDPIEYIKLNLRLKKTGININYNFIFGLPSETLSDIKQNTKLILRLVKENPNCGINPFIYTPYHGTKLFELENEKDMPKSLIEWSSYNREVFNTNNERRKKLIENVSHIIQFVNHGMEKELKFYPYKKFFQIYQEIARFRLKNLFFNFYIENHIFKSIKNMVVTDLKEYKK